MGNNNAILGKIEYKMKHRGGGVSRYIPQQRCRANFKLVP